MNTQTQTNSTRIVMMLAPIMLVIAALLPMFLSVSRAFGSAVYHPNSMAGQPDTPNPTPGPGGLVTITSRRLSVLKPAEKELYKQYTDQLMYKVDTLFEEAKSAVTSNSTTIRLPNVSMRQTLNNSMDQYLLTLDEIETDVNVVYRQSTIASDQTFFFKAIHDSELEVAFAWLKALVH